MGISLSGLSSGFDWQSVVTQLIEAERAPETRMRSAQSTLQQQNSAFGNIKTQLLALQTSIKALSDPALYDSRTSESDDETIATAKAEAGAPVGNYLFQFTQLATAARQRGTVNVGKGLSSSNNVSNLVLSSAGFSTSITAGNFTVNGKQISVATTDTLQAVFDKINSATGGVVSANYDPTTDRINLTSADEIVLGSSTDTSNFLQVARLYNNGSGAVSSTAGLGGVKLSGSISQANLATTLSDGGQGAGVFKINGVSISFSATGDSVQGILERINNSAAGVMASYDPVKDRFNLVNKETGDTGVSVQDVTGNFLAATGLLSGSLERGKNLLYTVNGGEQLVSQSNTVTGSSSGFTGLSVTALKESSVSITVGSDTGKIRTAITDFIDAYNKTQSLIDSQTASATDAKGKVTAGILAGDGSVNEIASKLRSIAFTQNSGLTTTIKNLADLGINTNGQDNTLKLADSAKLDAALSEKLSAIKSLFTTTETGLAVKLNRYLEKTAGEGGSLVTKQDSLTKQSANIDTQIADLERRLALEQDRLTNSFVAMETAQAKINQQLQYLQKQFSS